MLFRSLSAIVLTRQDAAMELLLDLIAQESMDAEAAIEEIMRSRPAEAIVKRLEKSVAGNSRLARALAAQIKQK